MIKHLTFTGFDHHPLYASFLGKGIPLVILHGGGPDRQSIIPFARRLKAQCQVIFPDIRGYGQSVCYDRAKHTWEQYASDVIALIDHLGLDKIVMSGMGLGASIAERVAFSYPERVKGLILVSPETLDKEGEGSSEKEKAMMDTCAKIALEEGLADAWKPFMADLSPVIKSMVREAFPRTDPRSFSAAMAIVHSQRLTSVQQLREIQAPTLLIPGNDLRHTPNIGKEYRRYIPKCFLGHPIDWETASSVDELAAMVAPQMGQFIKNFVKS